MKITFFTADSAEITSVHINRNRQSRERERVTSGGIALWEIHRKSSLAGRDQWRAKRLGATSFSLSLSLLHVVYTGVKRPSHRIAIHCKSRQSSSAKFFGVYLCEMREKRRNSVMKNVCFLMMCHHYFAQNIFDGDYATRWTDTLTQIDEFRLNVNNLSLRVFLSSKNFYSILKVNGLFKLLFNMRIH